MTANLMELLRDTASRQPEQAAIIGPGRDDCWCYPACPGDSSPNSLSDMPPGICFPLVLHCEDITPQRKFNGS